MSQGNDEKSQMGRPAIEIDIGQIAALMRFNPTLKDAAAFFKCSESTIARRIREECGGLTFDQFREQNMVQTRMTLIQKALNKAYAGDNVMLIFCLKNLCGWSDKVEQKLVEDKPFTLSYNLIDVKKAAEK